MDLHAAGLLGAGMMAAFGISFALGVIWTEFLCGKFLWRLGKEKRSSQKQRILKPDSREDRRAMA